MLEGDDARRAVEEERHDRASRRDLERRPDFQEISPEVGALDEGAFDEFMAEHPDAAMTLLADLTGAVDERLRVLARRLAGRVFLDVARSGVARARGVGRPRSVPADRGSGDLDLDRSLDGLVVAAAGRRAPAADELHVIELDRPATALCLVVDRSGSMGGERLATAAVAAAAVAWRAPADHSVMAFSNRTIVLQRQGEGRPPAAVTDDLLRLRGHGPTDLEAALRAAAAQLARSGAKRRITVLLSDTRANTGPDPVAAARRLDELVVLAPAGDDEDARAFAAAAGARIATVTGPAAVPTALGALLS